MQQQQQPISLPRNTILNNGRYRIERELNRGGTAVVYAAEDRATRSYVALKVMHGPDQVPLKVVKREITFSSSVAHDNIVRLLDVFAERQQLVIVWELISGPDLLDLLNECGGRMPEDMAAFYFTQALRGLVFMHANGFCHRDIKPENCMVQRSNHQLKLIDFGLSKHLSSARTLGVGTPDYMSPEILVHQQQLGYEWGSSVQPPYDARRVDAWAMGVLMYLLVTGRYPFEDAAAPNNLAATVANVLCGRMRPLPPAVSAGCGQLIAGLLQPRPERRSSLLELVDSPWLATAALQYARRVAAAEGRPHGSVGGPETWIDLRDYRQLAAMERAGSGGGGLNGAMGGGPGANGGGGRANGVRQQGAAVGGWGVAAAAAATGGPGPGRSAFMTAAAVAAPAGPSGYGDFGPGPVGGGGGGGGGGGVNGGVFGGLGLTPAASSSSISEELAVAAAGAMRGLAGVRSTAGMGEGSWNGGPAAAGAGGGGNDSGGGGGGSTTARPHRPHHHAACRLVETCIVECHRHGLHSSPCHHHTSSSRSAAAATSAGGNAGVDTSTSRGPPPASPTPSPARPHPNDPYYLQQQGQQQGQPPSPQRRRSTGDSGGGDSVVSSGAGGGVSSGLKGSLAKMKAYFRRKLEG